MDEATQKPTVECRPVSLETPCAHDRFSKYTSSHCITFASFLGLCLPCPQTARFCPVKQPSFKRKAAVVASFLHSRTNGNIFIDNLYSHHVLCGEEGFRVEETFQLRHKQLQGASDGKGWGKAFQAGRIARTNS